MVQICKQETGVPAVGMEERAVTGSVYTPPLESEEAGPPWGWISGRFIPMQQLKPMPEIPPPWLLSCAFHAKAQTPGPGMCEISGLRFPLD